jgi:hypothetical protein
MPPDKAASTIENDATASLNSPTAEFVSEHATDARPAGPAGLANYELLEEIGAGGMGVVYRARQRGADRIVALKMIRGAGALDPRIRERFRTEVRALARLRHPNIVQVYEVGEDGGQPFFSLEYVEGGSLAARLRADGPFAPAAAAELVRVLAGAVAAAHAAGVLHRDIKPANVLLSDSSPSTPKLTDFGLARWLDADAGVTSTGAMLGTPSYMAPEQAAGRNADVGAHTDVYALGATLYELLTGDPPFRADTPLATAALVINAEPRPPRSLRPGVPPELEAICLKCLEKESARRYATAAELADDLGRWLRGESTVARPLSRPRRVWRTLKRRRWAVAAVLGAVLVAGGGFAAAQLYVAYYAPVNMDPDQPEPPDPDAVVKEYTRKLAADEEVTLIGETGPPRWHRWAVDTGFIRDTNYKGKRVCHIHAPRLGVLELLPDPGRDWYQISGEFLLETVGTGGMHTALSFGYQEAGTEPGLRVAQFFQAGFEEMQRAGVREDKIAVFRDRLMFWAPEGSEAKQPPIGDAYRLYPDTPGSPISRALSLDQKREAPLRKVEVRVSPKKVVVFAWEDDDKPVQLRDVMPGKPKAERPGVWTKELFAERTRRWNDRINLNFPGAGVRLREWAPRMPIGLVVMNAGVMVRNLVVKPLPPNSF